MPIDKREGETQDEFISRCMSQEVGDGKPQDQAYAICISKWENFAEIDLESYSDYPDGVKSNAKKVLDWTEKNGWGSCGTAVGKQRANQLANGEPISLDTIKRMYSYLSRHEVDLESSTSYSDGCGRLMYDAWGGKAALGWSHNKLKELGQLDMATASWNEPAVSINLSKISFDYDETLTTERGMELAKKLIDEGNDIYIISARGDKSAMLKRAAELGISESRVFATGSNKAKAEKVKELGITKHYDNNSDVVSTLPGIGMKFKTQRRVIFNEDFDEATVRRFKELGYKVHIRSARKIKRKDNKVWNRLKSVGLTEDHLVFGEVKELNRRWGYDLIMTGQDPILEHLKAHGKSDGGGQVIAEWPIKSFEDALACQEKVKGIDLKFVRVQVVYKYREIPGIPKAEKYGSRPFCTHLLSLNNEYTIDEIAALKDLASSQLLDMGLPEDPFVYRGGFYTNPDTGVTTPWCRHEWVGQAKIV